MSDRQINIYAKIIIVSSLFFCTVFFEPAIVGFNLTDLAMNKEMAINGEIEITNTTWKRLLVTPYTYISSIIPFFTMYSFSLNKVKINKKATPRFELGIKALQASALPLGHVA